MAHELSKSFGPQTYIDNDALNLGFILSLLDGPIEYPDRVIIFTANDKKLHPALIRPGRIDLDIHLKNATINQIFDIISFIYEYNVRENKDLFNKITDNIKDYQICPSAIYEACLVNHNIGSKDILDNISNAIDFIIKKINTS